ncbi:MAG: PAS domain S-box protein [Deltaproteobacteria bacterium]|nr:PAS domain S-box protein [Deltaproteobacteria bacterium]
MGSDSITLFSWLDDLLAEAGGDPDRSRAEAYPEATWRAVVARCKEIAADAGGPEVLLTAMKRLTNARFDAAAAQLPGSFNDQRQLYWAASRWLLPELLPDLTGRFEELSDGRLRFAVESPAEAESYPLLFDLMQCALADTPLLVRQPKARVGLESTARRAVFTIHPSTVAMHEFQPHYETMLSGIGRLAYEWDIKKGSISIRGEGDDFGFAVGGSGTDPTDLLADVTLPDRRRFNEELMRAMSSRDQFHVEYTHHPKGQEPIVVENVGYFVADEDGEISRMLGFAWNVTEERRKSAAQQEYLDMLDRIASASPEILYLFDIEAWEMLYINDAVEEILGFSSEEIRGEPERFARRIHPDDLDVLTSFQATVQKLTDEGVVDISFRIRAANDAWVWIKLRNRVISRMPDGGVHEVLGAATDITEYQRAQEERAISQERYRIVSELTSDYSFSVRIERDGSMMREWITEAFENITGYKPDQISEPEWEQLTHPDDIAVRRKQFNETIRNGHGIHQFRIIRKTGELRVIREHSRVIHNQDGSMNWYGACRDITEQEVAETARALIEERFNAITQSSRDVIVEFDEKGNTVYVSPNVRDLMGHTPESVSGERQPDLIHPDDIVPVRRRLNLLVKRGGSDDLIFRMANVDGNWRWMDTTATTFRTATGRIRLVLVGRDITERLEIEGERRRLVSIVENSSEFVAMVAADGTILFMNDAGQKMVGLADDTDLRRMKIFEFLAPDDAQDLRFSIAPAVEQQGHWEGEFRLRRLEDGDSISTLAHVFLVAGHRREQERVIAIVARNISDRITAERLLRESESRHRMLVKNAYDLIAEIDSDGRYIYASPNFEEQLGYPPDRMLGQSWYEQVHAEDRDHAHHTFRDLIEDRPHSCPPLRLRHADGSWRWVEANFKPYKDVHGESVMLAFFRDITRRKQAEEALHRSREELLQSQKMEAIGRLAGGVAHDFNNLLTAITGYCDLLLEEIGEQEQMRADAEEILRAAERAATLTRQLLAFSRRQVLLPKVFDLNKLVSDVERLLLRLIGEHIELVTVLESELPHVRLDPGQLEQLVINLAVNARDAMPRGGHLSITTENLEIPSGGDPAHPGIAPASYVTLSVSDTGVGMDAATQSKIFEPFFSTKESGKGTGLGLATVYGIIQQSGGEIRVESELGTGSTFTVYLPKVDEALPDSEPPLVHESLRGDETILLVEDSKTVRNLVLRYLEKHGYTVIDAESGVEGLRIAAAHPGRIDLLITDVVLPKIDGHEFAMRLVEARPETKVIYMSGFSDDALARHEVDVGDLTMIQKPFTQRQLLSEVRRVLQESHPTESTTTGSEVTIPPRSEMH